VSIKESIQILEKIVEKTTEGKQVAEVGKSMFV
jgi:hypothetical protein